MIDILTSIINFISSIGKIIVDTIRTGIILITNVMNWVTYAISLITKVIPTGLIAFITLCIFTCILLRVIGRD